MEQADKFDDALVDFLVDSENRYEVTDRTEAYMLLTRALDKCLKVVVKDALGIERPEPCPACRRELARVLERLKKCRICRGGLEK